MKNLLFLLLFAGMPCMASAADTLRVKTLTYCDHCKECESCWARMEKELKFTPGVKGMSFDDKTMIITVIYNAKKTTPAKIRKAISKSGFDADEVKANAKAQGKLDGCCKKKE